MSPARIFTASNIEAHKQSSAAAGGGGDPPKRPHGEPMKGNCSRSSIKKRWKSEWRGLCCRCGRKRHCGSWRRCLYRCYHCNTDGHIGELCPNVDKDWWKIVGGGNADKRLEDVFINPPVPPQPADSSSSRVPSPRVSPRHASDNALPQVSPQQVAPPRANNNPHHRRPQQLEDEASSPPRMRTYANVAGARDQQSRPSQSQHAQNSLSERDSRRAAIHQAGPQAERDRRRDEAPPARFSDRAPAPQPISPPPRPTTNGHPYLQPTPMGGWPTASHFPMMGPTAPMTPFSGFPYPSTPIELQYGAMLGYALNYASNVLQHMGRMSSNNHQPSGHGTRVEEEVTSPEETPTSRRTGPVTKRRRNGNDSRNPQDQ